MPTMGAAKPRKRRELVMGSKATVPPLFCCQIPSGSPIHLDFHACLHLSFIAFNKRSISWK